MPTNYLTRHMVALVDIPRGRGQYVAKDQPFVCSDTDAEYYKYTSQAKDVPPATGAAAPSEVEKTVAASFVGAADAVAVEHGITGTGASGSAVPSVAAPRRRGRPTNAELAARATADAAQGAGSAESQAGDEPAAGGSTAEEPSA